MVSALLVPIVWVEHHEGVELVAAPPPGRSMSAAPTPPTQRRPFTWMRSSRYVTFSCSFLLCPCSSPLFGYFVSVYVLSKMVKNAVLAAKGGASTSQVHMPPVPVGPTSRVAPVAPIIVAVTTSPRPAMST